MEQPKTFESWCVVELFGHNQLAGMVTTDNSFGIAMVRVDVPETSIHPPFTRVFHPNAIYALNPCSEEVARRYAEAHQVRPMISYDVERAITKRAAEMTKSLEEGRQEEPEDYLGDERNYDDSEYDDLNRRMQ